jgi:hypothetical protein
MDDNIPRGSSAEEIAPYLDDLIDEVTQVKAAVKRYVHRDDVDTLHIDHLRERGLQVPRCRRTPISMLSTG